MHRYCCLLLLLHFPALLFSQSITINGIVTDTAGKALPLASVRLSATGTGTATNNAGQFSLRLPAGAQHDTLLISFLGYEQQRIAVKDIPSSLFITRLSQKIHQLEEVVVKPLSALQLVKDAIGRIPQNYYNQSHISHGFYRIDTKKGEEHIMLSEAVFDILNHGYASRRPNSFRLLKMRSVQDEQASHGLDLGLRPRGLYEMDMIGHAGSSELLGRKGLKNHVFRLRGITTYEGLQVYEIGFDQREGVRESLFKGTLYLDINSLAFIAIDFGRSPRGISYARYGTAAERTLMKMIGLEIDILKDDMHISYRRLGEKWVLGGVRNDNIFNFKSNRRFYDFPANIRVDYIITGVDTTTGAVLAHRGTSGGNKLIELRDEAFEKDFWKEHNILLADYNSDTIAAAIQARNQSFSLKNKVEARLKKFPRDPATRIDSIISYYHREGAFNGTVLVKHNGNILVRKGYGLADKENNRAAADTTQYRIGSLTKTFTSLLIQQLAEENKLSLPDSIGSYLPSYVHGHITVEQLLTHTSGIPSYTNDPEALAAIMNNSFAIPAILSRYCSDSLEFTPGSQFRYSNSGYLVLAALIESVTGQSYGEVLAKRIFGPLGMKQSRFGDSGINSRGYWQGFPEPVYHIQNTAGAGGIISTVNDLLAWDEALYTSALLPQSRIQQSVEPRAGYNDWDAWYGYGWMIDRKLFGQSRRHRIIYHPGTDFGYYAMFVRQPDTNSLIVLLCNTGDFPRFDMTDLLLDAIN